MRDSNIVNILSYKIINGSIYTAITLIIYPVTDMDIDLNSFHLYLSPRDNQTYDKKIDDQSFDDNVENETFNQGIMTPASFIDLMIDILPINLGYQSLGTSVTINLEEYMTLPVKFGPILWGKEQLLLRKYQNVSIIKNYKYYGTILILHLRSQGDYGVYFALVLSDKDYLLAKRRFWLPKGDEPLDNIQNIWSIYKSPNIRNNLLHHLILFNATINGEAQDGNCDKMQRLKTSSNNNLFCQPFMSNIILDCESQMMKVNKMLFPISNNSYEWRFKDKLIQSLNFSNIHITGNTLFINQLTHLNSGIYTCIKSHNQKDIEPIHFQIIIYTRIYIKIGLRIAFRIHNCHLTTAELLHIFIKTYVDNRICHYYDCSVREIGAQDIRCPNETLTNDETSTTAYYGKITIDPFGKYKHRYLYLNYELYPKRFDSIFRMVPENALRLEKDLRSLIDSRFKNKEQQQVEKINYDKFFLFNRLHVSHIDITTELMCPPNFKMFQNDAKSEHECVA
ncbi:unnamed protein product [Gordionus sp. m RMFG-2023]